MSDRNIINFKVNIVDLIGDDTPLTKSRGDQNYRGCCPIHGGTNDTQLLVNERQNDFYCFSCGCSGGPIEYVMEKERLDYFEAIKYLANKYNITLGDDFDEAYEDYFDKETELKKYQTNVEKVIEYLKTKRGFNDETIGKMKYGFDGNNLIIPVFDKLGRLIAFTKRTFGSNKAKYINEKNTDIYKKGEVLYNIHNAKYGTKNGSLYVVEGYLDASSGQQMGLPTVAYCGSELAKEQILAIKDLSNYSEDFIVYLCPDNDETGLKKIPRMRDKFKQYAPKLTVHIVTLPDGIKDFNDALLANINIKDLGSMNIDMYCALKHLDTFKTKDQEYNFIGDYILTVDNPMIRADIAKSLSDRWGQSLTEIKAWLNTADGSDSLMDEFKGFDEAINELADMYVSGECNLGFEGMDTALSHVRQGEVVIVAARPSVGKTFFGVHTALHNVVNEKRNVLFFTLEMSNAQLYERIISYVLKCESKVTKDYILNKNDIIYKVKEALDKRLLTIDKSNLSIEDIMKRIALANSRKFDEPATVVIIDYIQKLKDSKDYAKFADACERLKEVAKEFNVMLLVLCQLNRTEKSYQRPTMESLRGAGELEQVGDIILGMSYPADNPELTLDEKYALENVILVNLLKARRGAESEEFYLIRDKEESRLKEVFDIEKPKTTNRRGRPKKD